MRRRAGRSSTTLRWLALFATATATSGFAGCAPPRHGEESDTTTLDAARGVPEPNQDASEDDRNFTFAPAISSDCRALAAPPPLWHEVPFGDLCVGGSPFWLLSATNEDIDFRSRDKGTVHMSDMRPRFEGEDDSPWNYGFYAMPNSRYRIGWALDKVNFPSYVDRHTGAFVNDSFDINPGVARPTVNDDLVIEMDVRLRGEDRETDPRRVTTFREPNWDEAIDDPLGRTVGAAKNRILVGVSARASDGTVYYLEVNLYRSKNWDLVDDAKDIIDRTAAWDLPGISRGQVVYFNGPRLSHAPGETDDLPTLSVEPDGDFRHFVIPVSALFKNYEWPFATASWEDVQIAGIYFGAEIWGRGRLWFEVEGYRLFAPPRAP
ncbi:MAG: hypothetical protein H6729_07980 [Deltaproteobacteria bacterium]|nr:hypothetical protein [Deltaproteobacteria bacterium]